MKKKIFIALMASVSLFALAACGSGNKQVTAGGSTALQPMVEHASMAYMKQNPDEIIIFDAEKCAHIRSNIICYKRMLESLFQQLNL